MFEQVRNMLVEELSVNKDDIKPESNLANDLGVNSLELADLILMCEEKFNLEINDDAVHEFITVADVADYLEKNAK